MQNERTATRASRPRSVLFISGTGDLVGGAQVSLLQLTTNLDRSRYVPLVLTSAPGSLTEKLEAESVEVIHEPGLGARYLRGNYARLLRASLRMATLLRRRRIKLVHNNSWVPGDRVFGVAATRFLTRTPYLHHERDTWTPNRKADKLTARFATRIISISDAVSMKFEALGADHKITKIFNGVDLSQFTPDETEGTSASLRKTLNLPPSGPVVGIFSRMGREKGHPDLLQSAAVVSRQCPEAHFLLVGSTVNDDGYLSSLRTTANELGISHCVHFLGFRDDVPDLMRLCTFTVCPSTHVEPFGRVIIESMACERPVIASAEGGPTEIIDHGTNGLLVKAGAVDAWAKAMLQLLDSPDAGAAMGSAGRLAVAERFDIQDHASAIQALYDTILTKDTGTHLGERK